MDNEKVSTWFSECPKTPGKFKFRDYTIPFVMTEWLLERARFYGPKMTISFEKKEVDGEMCYMPGSTWGDPFQSYYYIDHPDEVFWEIEPHIEIEGYSPLKINSLEEIQVGDCELIGDKLWSYRTLGNMFEDYVIAPVDNLRQRTEYGGFKNTVMFANLNNKLYRKNKKGKK